MPANTIHEFAFHQKRIECNIEVAEIIPLQMGESFAEQFWMREKVSVDFVAKPGPLSEAPPLHLRCHRLRKEGEMSHSWEMKNGGNRRKDRGGTKKEKCCYLGKRNRR
ncbi:hypothetical protein NPIL_145991 [Nephila pilipes]|uniref:Uncharacterized protein n=1 Tax=Nephila pilipes TaxID=299642 RepID=A0A8X6QAM0_NEPPI|nr:hypothetical protein NPIL_145991 [Nephila pilipes]